MTSLGVFVFALMGAMMTIDEMYCHRQRKLGAWERWGHPLDTFLFLLPLGLAVFAPVSGGVLWLYAGLALLSALAVTKDEWVHHKECDAFEQWVHSVLFLLHGASLVVVGLLWYFEQALWLRQLWFFATLAWLGLQLISAFRTREN